MYQMVCVFLERVLVCMQVCVFNEGFIKAHETFQERSV